MYAHNELSEDDINVILNKANYWHEVYKRENRGHIAKNELNDEIQRMGEWKMLFILEEYAKIKKFAAGAK